MRTVMNGIRRFLREERKAEVPGRTILGIVIFVLAAQFIYILLAGGAFRWLVKHDCPYNYPGSVWESEDPRIRLRVVDGIPEHADAYLIVDGEEMPVVILMDDHISDVSVYDSSASELLLTGSQKTTSEKVVIKVYPEHDRLFNNAYSKIVLHRVYTPYLAEEESYFRDFRIEGDSVVFSCRLVLFNPQDSEIPVEIVGDFSPDAEAGLVREDALKAVSPDDETVSRFVLPPGRTELDVVFIGTHGSGDVRQDRLLPEIELVPVG